MKDAPIPRPGERFGNYLIDSEIAKGGFSIVLRAMHQDGTPVAIKILAPQDASVRYSQNLTERFAREARLLKEIRSPFTVQLLEYGTEPQSGLLYMAFELVEGLSLFDLIKGEGPQSPRRMLAILKQCLMGLARAHAVGILHRDLKPNNIMLFKDGAGDRVKVIDFGIAKRLDDGGQDLTTAGTLVGTPRYMSPEQLRCLDLAPSSDIYSLGLCMVELLTARKAVWGKTRTDVITRQLSVDQPVPVPEQLTPTIRAIVSRMVEKIPQRRYQSADEILADIDAYHQQGADQRDGDTVYQSVTEDVIQSMIGEMPKPPQDETILQSIRIDSLPNIAAMSSPMDETVMSSDLDRTFATGERVRQDSGEHLPQIPIDDSRNWIQKQEPHPSSFSPSTGSDMIMTPPVSGFSSEIQVKPEPTESSNAQDPQDARTFLIANIFLPGAGHLLAGFKPKGAIFLASWFMFAALSVMFIFGTSKGALDYILSFITVSIVLVVSAAGVLDLWLSIRASRRRSVEPLEFLPDIADVMERLK